jgi:hypothetical protein
MGMQPGEPDLRLHWKALDDKNRWQPMMLYLELKSDVGRVTTNQSEVMADLTNLGFPCEVVRRLEEAVECFKSYGVPTAGIRL